MQIFLTNFFFYTLTCIARFRLTRFFGCHKKRVRRGMPVVPLHQITLFSDFSALCNYYFLRIQFPHQKLVALLGCFPSNTTSHSNFFIPPPEALFILQEVTNNAVQTYVFYFCVTREGESYSATPPTVY